MIKDLRNDLFNYLIVFMIKHCNRLHASVFYATLDHMNNAIEPQVMLDSWIRYKREKGEIK